MAQTKIIVDTNSYFRLAQNLHPLPLGKKQKAELEETFDYMWEYVKDAFHEERGKGSSYTDTLIVATAAVLKIRVVTDDQDMIELAEVYGVHQITSLELMHLMLEEAHIDLEKVEQVVAQWQYDNDTPYKEWKAEYKRLFKQVPPGE